MKAPLVKRGFCFCFSGFWWMVAQTPPFAQASRPARQHGFFLSCVLVFVFAFLPVRWFLPSGLLVAVGFVKSHIFAFKEA